MDPSKEQRIQEAARSDILLKGLRECTRVHPSKEETTAETNPACLGSRERMHIPDIATAQQGVFWRTSNI